MASNIPNAGKKDSLYLPSLEDAAITLPGNPSTLYLPSANDASGFSPPSIVSSGITPDSRSSADSLQDRASATPPDSSVGTLDVAGMFASPNMFSGPSIFDQPSIFSTASAPSPSTPEATSTPQAAGFSSTSSPDPVQTPAAEQVTTPYPTADAIRDKHMKNQETTDTATATFSKKSKAALEKLSAAGEKLTTKIFRGETPTPEEIAEFEKVKGEVALEQAQAFQACQATFNQVYSRDGNS